MLKIQQKLKTDEYENIDALQSDVELLVNNTKAFYKVGVCILQCSVLVYCIGSLVFMRDIATFFHYCPGKRGIQHPRKQLPSVINSSLIFSVIQGFLCLLCISISELTLMQILVKPYNCSVKHRRFIDAQPIRIAA